MTCMSNELMLLGVATLILLTLQKDIAKMCGEQPLILTQTLKRAASHA